MPRKGNNAIRSPKEVGTMSQSPLTAKVEVGQLDKRVTNVEKVTQTVSDLLATTINSVNEYFKKKNELEREQLEFEHIQHKRVVYLLSLAMTVVFILTLVAMLESQTELVKLFITSSLAVAAGSGLVSFLRAGHRNKDKGSIE
ncbi:MAG: hypothetical protein KGJ59_11105 [Bacteroidota bacterium]|nr:hypothetical protein [Bacteroidota bacterium]